MVRTRGGSYKKLYEDALKNLRYARSSRFAIIEDGDRDCDHVFSWIVDSQGGGIVGATYTCGKCHMIIDQTIGERYAPENIPTDSSITTWRE